MEAATYIFANTGQTVRLVVQTVDGYGERVDGYVPVVESVIFPDLSEGAGYPQQMTNLHTGLYAHGIQLPEGADALGTYVASVFLIQNGESKWVTFAIHVARPFGNSSVSPM